MAARGSAPERKRAICSRASVRSSQLVGSRSAPPPSAGAPAPDRAAEDGPRRGGGPEGDRGAAAVAVTLAPPASDAVCAAAPPKCSGSGRLTLGSDRSTRKLRRRMTESCSSATDDGTGCCCWLWFCCPAAPATAARSRSSASVSCSPPELEAAAGRSRRLKGCRARTCASQVARSKAPMRKVAIGCEREEGKRSADHRSCSDVSSDARPGSEPAVC